MLAEFPKEVRIENTNLCNAVCTMCPREKLSRERGTMDTEFFGSLVGQLSEGGTEELHLQGYGEPLLDDGIFDKIRMAKDGGIPYTFMVTNASLLDDERCRRLVESGLDKLKISFYGLNKDEYEDVHKGLTYEEVRDNVERLLRVKKKARSSSPVVDLKYIGGLGKFLLFALQWGFKARVSYARLHNYGDGRGFNKPDLDNRLRSCPMVASPVMQVLWDGRVVPCCYDFDGKIILGDLTEESIKDVWGGQRYTKFREVHQRKEFEKLPLCLNCDKLR